jgi:hypothetical protein
MAKKEGHAQAPSTPAIYGLPPQILVSRDQRLRLRDIPCAARWFQRRFFPCRPNARSMPARMGRYGEALLNGTGQAQKANGWIARPELDSEVQNLGGEFVALTGSALAGQ